MNEIRSDDITIGTPVSGRQHDQLQDIIGLFLNVVLIRVKGDKNKTFTKYLQDVNSTIIDALDHQDYPYEELYDLVSKKFRIHDKSLFSIMINFMPYQQILPIDKDKNKDDVTFTIYDSKKIISKYDITFYINENKEDITIDIVYKEQLFEKYTIERMGKAFEYISSLVIDDEMTIIKDIDYSKVMSEDEETENDIDKYFQ